MHSLRWKGAKRIYTTTYHPASNGMIERWHRTLKTAIRCHTSTDWINILSTVLLGLRSSVKQDLKAAPTELVYGTTLRLPGEFFIDIPPTDQPRLFLEKLRSTRRELRPTSAAHHIKRKPFIHNALHTCTHVFVRVDLTKKNLEPPYDGPYRVIERISDKVFKVQIKGNPQTVTAERLKPAFMEQQDTYTDEPETDQPASSSQQPANQRPLRTYPAKKRIRFALWKCSNLAREEYLWRPKLVEKSIWSLTSSSDHARYCNIVRFLPP